MAESSLQFDPRYFSADVLAKVDFACDHFENSWNAGGEPSIEDIVSGLPITCQRVATAQLIRIELELLGTKVTSTDIAAYQRRFPEFAEVIAECSNTPGNTLSAGCVSTAGGPVNQQAFVSPAALPCRMGRYRVERELGQGGMGAVYLAHDTVLERQVALKFPKFGNRDATKLISRFSKEARSMAAIRHPNLCAIYDLGKIDEFHFLSMEFIEGKTLAQILSSERQITEHEAAQLISQVCRAVQLAHDAGVVHRDLKPANIMTDVTGRPVVMDFGLALHRSTDSAAVTDDGLIVGSPAYMAPEQLSDSSDYHGPQVDVYSLGVMLYELISGEPPLTGSAMSVLGRLAGGKIRPLIEAHPECEPELNRICMAALAHDTRERIPSAAQFADQLDGWLAGQSESAPGQGTLQERVDEAKPALSKSAFRRQPANGYSGIVAIVLLLTIVLALRFGWLSRSSESQPDLYAGPVPAASALWDSDVAVTAGQIAVTDSSESVVEDVIAVSDMATMTGDAPFLTSPQQFDIPDVWDSELVDVDNDGDHDLILASAQAAGAVWLNDGAGVFRKSPNLLPVGGQVATGDVDGDGDVDAWIVPRHSRCRVVLNNGAGRFLDSGQELGRADGLYDVTLADLDGDGDLDGFVSHGGARLDPTNEVFLNDGTGMYEDSGQRLGNGNSRRSVAFDADGDGDLDVCTANVTRVTPGILWVNDGNAVFTKGQELAFGCRAVDCDDLDGDGHIDLVLGNALSPNQILLNDGRGRFFVTQRFGTLQCEHVTLADLDNDGDADVIAANQASLTQGHTTKEAPIMIWWNNGSGRFDAACHFEIRWNVQVSVGDVDGDEDLDLITVARDGTVRLRLNRKNQP